MQILAQATAATHGTLSTTEERAIALLGKGISPTQVASALGVSDSRISQLLSQEHIAQQVVNLRFAALQENNARDEKIDTLEDKLIKKIEDLLPLINRPMEALKAFQVLNAAKRRGAAAPTEQTIHNTVVNLVMPSRVVQAFTVNTLNQVVSAGSQDLVTMQSGTLLSNLKAQKVAQSEAYNEQPELRRIPSHSELVAAANGL